MKITIQFKGKQESILELLINIALQIDKNRATFLITLYAFKTGMHIDDLIYYLKLMEVKE